MTHNTSGASEGRQTIGMNWYGALFEESLLPSWICDARSMVILDVNRSAVLRYGYARDEFLGMLVTDLLRPVDVPALIEAAAQESAHFDRGVWEHRTKSGVWIAVDVCAHRLPLEGGALLHMIIHEPPRTRLEGAPTVKEVRDAEERFRVITENLDTVLWISKPGQEGMLYLSPAFERVWGARREEIYSDPDSWMKYVHPDDRGRVLREIEERRRLRPMHPVEQTYRIVRGDGEIRWIRTRIIPVHSAAGTLDRVVGMAEDITLQRSAEDDATHRGELLRESENRYKELFHQSLAGVYRSTLDGSIIECNEAFAAIMGFTSPEDLKHVPAGQLYETLGDRANFIEELTRHGRLSAYELKLRRQDGTTVWVLENVALLGGAVIQGTMLDITERKKLEVQLKGNEELLRRIIDSSSDIIVLQDAAGRYLYAKPSPAYGVAPDGLIGKTPHDVFESADAEIVMRNLERVVLTGQPSVTEDRLIWNGEELWFHAQRSPVFDNSGAVTAVVTFARNITDLKRAEAEIRENRERLRLEELRVKIAADLHDDIGSTLSSTSIFNAMLRQAVDPDNASAVALLNRIDENLRSVQESLHDIVWAINPENDRLETVILHMREFAVEIMEARGIALRLDAADVEGSAAIPMRVRRDLYLLFKEAVANVVNHAECTEAYVRILAEAGVLHVEISDNGKGFTTSRRGSGRGLVNMESRARAIGATLEIVSQPGKGTTVVLRLPIT
jgi:PAS domain S-box-containing protein